MKKGQFGLSLAFIAAVCFGFGILSQPLAVLLICGYALIAERDVWLNRQVLQALLLTIFYHAAVIGVSIIFSVLQFLVGYSNFFGGFLYNLHSFLDTLIYAAFILFSVIAILKVIRGNEAELPYLSKFSSTLFP